MTTTIVVMGVSGSGKSTVAAELVTRTGWVFAEGDDFHSRANVAKMQPASAHRRGPLALAAHAGRGWIGEHERPGATPS